MFRETSACPVFLLVSVSACETSHASLMKPVSRSTLKQVSASTVCTASQSLKPATGSRRNWFRGVRWTRYSAALPPHRNQRKTSHRNQQPTHNETSNTPHRDSPIPRSETSDTDLKHSRSTTFETSDKPPPETSAQPNTETSDQPTATTKPKPALLHVGTAKSNNQVKGRPDAPLAGRLAGALRAIKTLPSKAMRSGASADDEPTRNGEKSRRALPGAWRLWRLDFRGSTVRRLDRPNACFSPGTR